jgi:hypothetical protein
MANYFITFRIADRTVGGKTYDERRQQLMDNVYTKGQGFWVETTSFVIAASTLNTWQFGTKAVQGLSASDDIVVVFDPADMSMGYFGPIQDVEVLRSFFGESKKLP